jgi:hypothetical protein
MLLIFVIVSTAKGYDNEIVHQAINENAAKQSNNLLNALTNLGVKEGLENVVYGKKIYKWFHEGAKLEDETVCRSRNHFHDPLKPWGNAGLNNEAVNAYCLSLGFEKFSVDSSLIWAQKESLNPFYDNLWSWPKARTYYYKALTLPTIDEREKNFAYTFRALGQITHLIADSSVPAHVRNDIHVFPLNLPIFGVEVGSQTYESWAKRNARSLNYNSLTVDQSNFSQAISNSSAQVPISALWDQDKYNTGSNINDTIGMNIGLSEYTNANFFSEDTIFKNYPHPTYEDTNFHLAFGHPESVDAEDGKFDNRVYIRKTVGDADAHLASFSYISYDIIKKGYYKFSPFVLDDKVYNDYAALLIPRAVGYSAGLLNYFFRGDIDMISDDTTGSGYVIVNNSDEDMNGTFELFYDKTTDERIKIGIPVLSTSLAIGKNTSANNKSPNITFTAPTDAKEPGKYVLVFKGKIGNEEGAVVGKIIESPSKSFLFLIASPTLYRTWEIGDNLVDLEAQFPSNAVSLINLEGGNYSISTVKSNQAENEHHFCVQNFISFPSASAFSLRMRYGFGTDTQNIGLRNDYEPPAWDATEEYAWNPDVSYRHLPQNPPSNPYLFCSSRHPSIVTGGNAIKDMEIWRNDILGNLTYKYKTEAGILSGSYPSAGMPQTVLDPTNPDAYIGEGSSLNRNTYTSTRATYQSDGSQDDYTCAFTYSEDIAYLGNATYLNGKSFKFGNYVLDGIGESGYSSSSGFSTVLDNPIHYNSYSSCPEQTFMTETYRYSISDSHIWNSKAWLMDYDNENTDATFIILYFLDGVTSYRHTSEMGGAPNYYTSSIYSVTAAGEEFVGNGRIWKLGYKTPTGTTVVKELNTMEGGGTLRIYSNGAWTYDDTGRINGATGNTATTWINGRLGSKRLVYPSVKVTSKYLLYSYVLQKLIDLTGFSLNDTTQDKYAFHSRIIGVIDRETGEEAIKIIDVADGIVENPAAIGLHKGGK